MFDPYALKIYGDGSALKNPGPGGIAGIAEFPDSLNRENEVIFEEGYFETTNNRMELLAVIRALEYARRVAPQIGARRVLVISDSTYVCEYVGLAPRWKQNKWRNLDGKPVENGDLWNELLSLRAKVRASVEVRYMKGKSTALVKEVDRRAKAAASQPTNVDRGFRGGKVARSKTETKSASALFPAKGGQAVINIYRKKMASKAEDKVYFDLFSESTGEFIGKYHAYTTHDVAHELHRSHRYRVQFSANPKHPVIETIVEEVVLARMDSASGGEQ